MNDEELQRQAFAWVGAHAALTHLFKVHGEPDEVASGHATDILNEEIVEA